MAFEGQVDVNSKLRPVTELSRRLDACSSWTCVVDNGVEHARQIGTGILVGKDLVLTNYHVVEALLSPEGRRFNGKCRFDFEKDENEQLHPGFDVSFHQDWDVTYSPYSALDRKGGVSGFGQDYLDFAIVRLARSIGSEPSRTRSVRGWLTLSPTPPLPEKENALYIIHHPADRKTREPSPKLYSDGKVLSLHDEDLRLRHSATTYPGSSGAACFDIRMNFVALHHCSEREKDDGSLCKWNQAIPAIAIARRLWADLDHRQLLNVAPPPSRPLVQRPASGQTIRERQGSNAKKRRIRAASVLMDRDGAEAQIIWSQHDQNPGMVHVLTARHLDNHHGFLTRLEKLSLLTSKDGFDAQQGKILAFLQGKDVPSPWQRDSLAWQPSQYALEDALAIMDRDLVRVAAERQPVFLEMAVDLSRHDVKPAREKKLMRALAQRCAELTTADHLQVFVVYHDRTATAKLDPTRERRNELAQLWSSGDRPPHCGVCINLDDISSDDLRSWYRAIKTGWRLKDDRLMDEIGRLMGDRVLPMLTVEERITPAMERFV